MKKLIGIFLSSALIFTLFASAFSANAETTVYNIGDRPYGTANSKDDIVVSSGENLSFYDDFIVKDNIEAYSDDVPIVSSTAWKLEGKFNTSSSYNSVAINTDSSNAYGGEGQSLKLTYQEKAPSGIVAQGETATRYYHRLASQKTMTITKDFWDTAAVAFWVKTENPVYILVRCLDYSYEDSKQFLISKEIKLSSGEYIVEVPLSGLAVSKDNYVKGNGMEDSANKTILYYPEILVRPSKFGAEETERDIYIDNLGYYNIRSNGTQNALHNGKALTKLTVSDYEQVADNPQQISREVNGTIYKWYDIDSNIEESGSTISPADDVDGINPNAYAGQGQSIKYTASNVCVYEKTKYNCIKTNEVIKTSDKNDTYWGKDATLAIWVKSSRAITVYAAAGDGTGTGKNFYKTDKEYVIPAGESILRIPVSDFNIDNPLGGESCDRAFTWNNIQAFRLYFKCAAPGGESPGINLYIDEIAIEAPIIGDTNDDAVVDIIDLIRMKKYIAETDYTDMDLMYFDVGGQQTDDKGFSVADGAVDGTDLTVMKKYLLGSGKIAIEPYSDSAAATSLVATVSASWGFDTV